MSTASDSARKRWLTPTGRLLTFITRTLIAVYRLTGGLIGGRMRKLPGILVTTTGRRSGEARTVHLPYIPYGDDMVVVASFAGGPRNPAWYHNLKANPTVHVQYMRDTFDAVATQIEGAEAEIVWEIVAVKGPWYVDYQKATERDIPLIKLQRLT